MRIGDGTLGETLTQSRTYSLPPPSKTSSALPDEPSSFAKILRGLGKEVDRGETFMRHAIHGANGASQSDLLALQAGVYRYSEAVDLASKLVDRATSGLKTVIQGQ